MKRRKFLHQSLAASATAALTPFPYHIYSGTEKKYATDKITLGNTGIEVSRLAMGTGTSGVGGSSNQTRKLGVKGLADLLYMAYDNGVRFWDSADQYGTHRHLKEGLKSVKREEVVILSKTHATTAKEMRADLDRFRQEIGTDYIDIILLHAITDPNWPKVKEAAMEVLAEAREEGIIRAHGISCHSLGALKTAAETDWVQVDLARYNQASVAMDDKFDVVRPVLEKMKAAGKGIIGMKVFGAGRLSDRIDESLTFALHQPFIDCFTIGQESAEQHLDLLKRIPAASVRG
ncbi:MAG: aldo/keto reductase [Saprospiraceae bacterium]|nr:aldo/keto reductase [Saprospiraceae bacterium]